LAPDRTLEPPSWLTRRIHPTDNVEIQRQMSRDRRLLFKTRVDAIYGLVDMMQHAQDRIGRLAVPTLYQYGAHDQIIPPQAAIHAAAKLGPKGRTAYYAENYHMMTRDRAGPVVSRDILAFIRDPGAPLPSRAPPIPRTLHDGAGVAASAAKG